MATTDGESPRKPMTAAQQRAQRETTQPAAEPTPTAEDLVEQIEQTRVDLASTLDEIAEKVSPKRVAKRTTKKVTESLKESAASAKEAVVDSAASAKEAAADTVTAAKKKVGKAGAAAEPVVVPEVGPLATPTVDETLSATPLAQSSEPAPVTGVVTGEPDALPADLPPVAAVPVPELTTAWTGPESLAGSLSGGSSKTSSLPAPKPVLAGVAVLGLLLALRRRRRRRR